MRWTGATYGAGLLTATPFRHKPQPSARPETSLCQALAVRPASVHPSGQYTISTTGSTVISASKYATKPPRTVDSISANRRAVLQGPLNAAALRLRRGGRVPHSGPGRHSTSVAGRRAQKRVRRRVPFGARNENSPLRRQAASSRADMVSSRRNPETVCARRRRTPPAR
jgi:hypothetical protein